MLKAPAATIAIHVLAVTGAAHAIDISTCEQTAIASSPARRGLHRPQPDRDHQHHPRVAVAFSAAVGIVFGFYPAQRAAGLDPITALRSE